jgi:hypothetical protein
LALALRWAVVRPLEVLRRRVLALERLPLLERRVVLERRVLV